MIINITYLCGDINVNMLKNNSISDIVDVHGMKNIVTKPTCFKSETPTLIDVVFTTVPKRFKHVCCIESDLSDFHQMVCFSTKFNAPRHINKVITYRSYKNFNREQFLCDLASAPFHAAQVFDTVDDAYWFSESLLLDVVNKHAPLKKRVIKQRQIPYMNSTLRKQNNVRDRFKRIWLKNKSMKNREAYVRHRNLSTKLRKQSLNKYLKDKCTINNTHTINNNHKGMCDAKLLDILKYSSDELRRFGENITVPPPRYVRKRLFKRHIWSCRSKYTPAVSGDCVVPRTVRQKEAVEEKSARIKSRPVVELGVMNCRSVDNKLDYIFDHCKDNKLDIVALTETWISNDPSKSNRVVIECAERGYTLHQIPRSSGRRGGGVGVMLNNSIKLTTRLMPVYAAESFESMELIITIVSISIRLVIIYRMPPSKENKIKRSSFITEFADYVEKLSCLNCKLIIVGDFNINWLDNNDCERKQFYMLLQTFGLVQRIDLPTYQNGHLLDYIITRESGDFASNFRVSNKISDHMALQVSLACQRQHPERKEIYVRSLRRIDKDALSAGLSAICVNHECSNVDIVVSQYNEDLSKLLDKHAPQKKIQIVDRPLNDWMNDDIQALKAIRRKKEDIWRKNPIVVNFEIYQDSCTAVKNAIAESKTHVMQEKIAKTKGDQKELFKIVKTLLCLKKQTVLPEYCDPTILASRFNQFFVDKIEHIRAEFPLLEQSLPSYSFGTMDSILPACTTIIENFTLVTTEELSKIISCMNKTICASDPFPTRLLISYLPIIIDVILYIVNLCITTNVFPLPCKSSIVTPLIKKPGLDAEILKNYRPVSNLSFLSKVIEKVIASRIISHIENNAIIDKFQSAYKCGHSTETALLRVYSDIVTTIGKGNGSFLVLLDLSAAFDTIDHSNLFDILEKYVGITGDALQLIKSYFSDRSQSTRIESIMSDIVHIICVCRKVLY